LLLAATTFPKLNFSAVALSGLGDEGLVRIGEGLEALEAEFAGAAVSRVAALSVLQPHTSNLIRRGRKAVSHQG